MTIKHLFPVAKPSLDLNFAATRKLDPRITFSRSSTGTYTDANGIIRTAAEDEPRFDHDPVTGESLGLLIEESRTNLYPISETYTSWNVKNDATITTDGTTIAGLTAIKLTSNVDTNSLFLEGTNATFTANTTYTSSVYHKVGNVDGFWFEARFFSGGGTPKIYFNSSTETWSATSGGTAPAIWSVRSQKVESNAWRHSITFYIDTDTAGSLRIGALAPANSIDVSTGDYGYLAAPQIEAGSFPTSYIPTSGSTATRAIDICTIEGDNFSSWYNQSEGTAFAEYDGLKDYGRVLELGSGKTLILSRPAINAAYDGVTETASDADLGLTLGDTRKSVTAYSGTTTTVTISGLVPRTGNSDFTSTTNTGIFLGGKGNNADVLNGHISRLAYYPRRLSDGQLQALTS
jgi:hypothetical protein